jgi:hypothetical protein
VLFYVDLILPIKKLVTRSVSACFEEFQERFPIVAIVYEQFRQTLHLCLNNFRESGTIGRKEGSGQVKKRTQEVIGNVQQIMEDSPTTSIRHLSQQVDRSFCWNLSKNFKRRSAFISISAHGCPRVTCK